MRPMLLAALVVVALQFGLHQVTESGVDLMRALRSGALHVLFAVLLLHALFAPAHSLVARFFRSPAMVSLGKYSYGLYVYHHFFSHYMLRHGTEFKVARAVGSHTLAVAIQAVIGMAASMVIAWVSYEWFEKYFLQLKRFWSPSVGRREGSR